MSDDADSKEPESVSLAQSRSRRSRGDKSGRLAALEKLRNLKGSKNKYQVSEVQNVYDVVEESEYSKKVHERQRDDWIIDDGSGYYEDGREIFDDDIIDGDDDLSGRGGRKSRSKKDKTASKAEKKAQVESFHSIRNMLANMPVKRKRADEPSSSSKAMDDEATMNDFMAELHNEKKSKSGSSCSDVMKKISGPSFEEIDLTMRKPQAPKPFIKPLELKKFKPSTNGSNNNNSSPSAASSSSTYSGSTFKKAKINESSASKSTSVTHPHNNNTTFDNPLEGLPDNFADDFMDDDFDEPIITNNGNDQHESSHKTLHKIPTVDVSIVKTEPVDSEPESPTSARKPDIPQKVHAKAKLEMIDDMTNDKFRQDEEDDMDIESEAADLAPDMENKDESGGKSLNFYWLDLYEEPQKPGTLYLFGKVKPPNQTGYVSCCIVVKKLTRCYYFLPRQTKADGSPVKVMDVYTELNDEIFPKYKITEFKSRKVEKNYCFDLEGVPAKAEYLEVRYTGDLPPLREDVKGETFSKIFGISTPLMETFLLEKKFKGPSWLTISNYEEVDSVKQVSWSKFEFTCDVKNVKLNPEGKKLPPPPLVLVSLNLQSVNDATSKKDTIIFAGVAVNKSFQLQTTPKWVYSDSFCLLNKPPGEIWPLDVDRIINKRITKMDSERSMLGCLLAKLQQLDPDVYLGHDLNMELLILHLLHNKVPNWSRIGRLKRSSNPVTKGKMLDIRGAIAGRLLCDVKVSAMELIRARSYDLPSLGSQVLGMKEEQIVTLTGPEMKQLFDSSEGLRTFVDWGMQHCVLNIRLINELQVMPLAVQITTIAGNTLSRTLLGGRSERNEYLLLHAFHGKNYIVPDKYKNSKFIKKEDDDEEGAEDKKEGGGGGKKGKSGGPSYLGGLVLAPKKGFYDNYIVLMDFNSLYPSIIQEYNVCFTTNPDGNADDDAAKDKPIGILPEEISRLVESRKAVKNLMKASNVSEDLMKQYDIRQKALKLTANSMYGCLGFRMSRFYAKNLAAYITGKGRDILMNTKDAVEKMGFEVIYGDTDSIMINSNTTDIQQVYQIGNKIKADINKMYKLLELEIDGIFRFLLLLKKKKYAALVYNPKAKGENEYVMELKGLDIVRRDWAPIGAKTAKACLNEIMTEQPLDDKIYKITKILGDVSTQLREGNVVVKDLLITKQLAKNPEEYKEAAGQYHVQVALRMNKSGNLPRKFRNGDTVSYLFCTDGLAHHLTELENSHAAKPEEKKDESTDSSMEVKEEKPLQPDPEYYLAHQVHPVVSRICDPIPGLDGARIAEALGLDPTSYKRRRTYEDSKDDNALGQETEAEKYTDCEKFSFKCFHPVDGGGICGQEIIFQSAIIKSDNGVGFAVEQPCPNCQNNPYNLSILKNHISLFIRKFVLKYYKNTFICEDPSCANTLRVVPFYLERGFPVCSCKQGLMCREYTDAQLYRQLNYLAYVFNIKKQMEELSTTERDYLNRELKRKPKPKDSFHSELEMFHESIVNFVVQSLESSGYSDISLTNLFSQCSFMLETRKALMKKVQGG